MAMQTFENAALSPPAAKEQTPRHECGGHDEIEVLGQFETVAQVTVGEPVKAEVERELDVQEGEDADH